MRPRLYKCSQRHRPCGPTRPKALRHAVCSPSRVDLLRIIFSVILPPLGVFLQVGIGKHFWLNVLLTLLGYIPGVVHAVWVIAKD